MHSDPMIEEGHLRNELGLMQQVQNFGERRFLRILLCAPEVHSFLLGECVLQKKKGCLAAV